MAQGKVLSDPESQRLLEKLRTRIVDGDAAPNQIRFVDWTEGLAKLQLTILTGDRVASTNLLGDPATIIRHLDSIADADDPIAALEETRKDPIPQAAVENVTELVWQTDRPKRTDVWYTDSKQKAKKLTCNHQDVEFADRFRSVLGGDTGRKPSDGQTETVSARETLLWSLVPTAIVLIVCGVLGYAAYDIQENGIDVGEGQYRNKGLSALLQSGIGLIGPYGFLILGVALLVVVLGRAAYKSVKKPSRIRLELRSK